MQSNANSSVKYQLHSSTNITSKVPLHSSYEEKDWKNKAKKCCKFLFQFMNIMQSPGVDHPNGINMKKSQQLLAKKRRNCGLTSIGQGLVLLPQAWLLFCLHFMFAPLSLHTFQPVLAINSPESQAVFEEIKVLTYAWHFGTLPRNIGWASLSQRGSSAKSVRKTYYWLKHLTW